MRYFLPLVVFILLITSCKNRQQTYTNLEVFRYNESAGITSLDPAFARSLPLIWPTRQLYNGLVELDDSLRVTPSLAKEWDVSDDGLEYTLLLRTDVFFHNSPAFPNRKGRRVVAQDFVFSVGRVINPQTASPGAWVFSVLDYNKPNTVHGCKVVNDSTLKIYLNKPFPAFLGLLSMPYAYIVPREAVEYYGDDFRKNPVGTGPFQLKLWREGEKLVLRRNPKYFERDEQGEQLPYFEAVSITFIADKQSEFLEFLLGNIDFLSGVHATSKDELLTRAGDLNPRYADRVKMISGPYLNTEYLGIIMDTSYPIANESPLRFEKVRKAIGYGFNRSRMMTYLRSNLGYPANNGFVPSGMPGFSDDVKGFRYDPDYARKLLKEAGFPNGEGLPTVTLCTTDDYVDISEFIQHQLAQIGIDLHIEVFPVAAYREMMANSRMVLFRGSWVADYADAENYLSLFYSDNFSPGGPNYTHFTNQQFDSLYNKALWQPNDTLRHIIYQKMDSLVMQHAPVIPLYYDRVVRFVSPNIVGMKSNPMNLLTLKRVRKTAE